MFQIIDFSTRLPGPWAAKLLLQQGANVVRIELAGAPDPFATGLGNDPSFPSWQRKLAKGKLIHQSAWNNSFDSATVNLLRQSQGMIFAPAVKPELAHDMRTFILREVSAPWVMINIAGKRDGTAWHDLNALAESHLLDLHHSSSPPFLPMAGMMLGAQVAIDVTTQLLRAREENSIIEHTVYLQDVVEQLAETFIPSDKEGNKLPGPFLHNGRFPCYRLYQTRDGASVAMAAVELRFWQNFVQQSGLALTPDDRFDESGRIIKLLETYFLQYDLSTLKQILDQKSCCLSC